MRTCYLTCGFVNLLRAADACSPLVEPLDRKSGDERALCCGPGSWGSTRQQVTQDDHLPAWTRPSDWKLTSRLRECRLRLRPSVASWPPSATYTIIIDEVETCRHGRRLPPRGRPQATSSAKSGRSAGCCGTGWGSRCSQSFLRCLATLPYRDRVTPRS